MSETSSSRVTPPGHTSSPWSKKNTHPQLPTEFRKRYWFFQNSPIAVKPSQYELKRSKAFLLMLYWGECATSRWQERGWPEGQAEHSCSENSARETQLHWKVSRYNHKESLCFKAVDQEKEMKWIHLLISSCLVAPSGQSASFMSWSLLSGQVMGQLYPKLSAQSLCGLAGWSWCWNRCGCYHVGREQGHAASGLPCRRKKPSADWEDSGEQSFPWSSTVPGAQNECGGVNQLNLKWTARRKSQAKNICKYKSD